MRDKDEELRELHRRSVILVKEKDTLQVPAEQCQGGFSQFSRDGRFFNIYRHPVVTSPFLKALPGKKSQVLYGLRTVTRALFKAAEKKSFALILQHGLRKVLFLPKRRNGKVLVAKVFLKMIPG